MTPQTLISLDVSPKKCHFFTELYICKKIIGHISDSMHYVKKRRADSLSTVSPFREQTTLGISANAPTSRI